MSLTSIRVTVNGEARQVVVEDDDLLLDVLRGLGHTSVREGCGVGACGACTVLVDGASVSGCLTRAVRCDGATVVTADGLPDDDPVVEAFVANDAMQCGYCIPGFVLMTHELFADDPTPTPERVSAHLEGNICRCGCYPEIRRAIETVSTARRSLT